MSDLAPHNTFADNFNPFSSDTKEKLNEIADWTLLYAAVYEAVIKKIAEPSPPDQPANPTGLIPCLLTQSGGSRAGGAGGGNFPADYLYTVRNLDGTFVAAGVPVAWNRPNGRTQVAQHGAYYYDVDGSVKIGPCDEVPYTKLCGEPR